MVCGPLQMAMSDGRDITVPDSPGERCVDAFKEQWDEIGADQFIFQTMSLSRVYGVASVAALIDDLEPASPLDPWALPDASIAFNVYDPLNTAGSLVLNQLPLAPDFMKPGEISVQGSSFHRSRSVTVMNEFPVYIAYTTSAFGFVGRSVYQRAFFPLKSYIKSMITDDMIETKVGVLVAKVKQAGSIANAIMRASAAFKRNVVKEAETGNTINITPEEAIESLNLQNMDAPHSLARRNILENIATAADMPIKLLAQEAFVEGFGEGTEDARAVAHYIDRVRRTMDPMYRFFDRIVMHRAWSPAFHEGMQRDFPQTYSGMDYKTAFYRWANSFSASWPSLLKEPESEQARLEDVKLKAVIAIIQVFEPVLDSENKLNLYQWATDNISENKSMFVTPLEFDFEALAEHIDEQESQQQEQQQASLEGQQQMNGDGGQGGQEDRVAVKLSKADALAGRFDRAAKMLATLPADVRDVVPLDALRKALAK
jgi:flagellar biosynthesis/type III secretory pathway protein FliH